MAIPCTPTPSALLAAARCISCLTPKQQRMVAVPLLCQTANTGIGTLIPTPTGFSFLPTDLSGNTVVASWNAPPAGVTGTEVWTSTDNVTFALATTVASPGTSGGVTYGGAGIKNWCKVRWVNASAQSPFTTSIVIPGEVPVWIKAVVTNGGAQVSQGTALAMNTFAISLSNASIDQMMQAVTCFVPDNLIAALTPLYKMAGNDPWTNFNAAFVAGDLTVNGLKGNSTTKALDTGLILTNIWKNTGGNVSALTSGGISIYNSTLGATANVDSGIREDQASNCFGIFIVNSPGVSNLLLADFSNQTAGTGRISVTNTGWTGFTSFNNTSPTARAVYTANSVTAFNTLGSAAGNILGNAFPGAGQGSLIMFGNRNGAGTIVPNVDRTFSFAGIHFGLTSAQAQSLFNAVQALRTSLGGGFV